MPALRAQKPPVVLGGLNLPTMFTAAPAGARLRELAESGAVTVTTRGIESSPYRYNLFYPSVQQVPTDPAYEAHTEDLGSVQVDYRGPGGPLPMVYSAAAIWHGEESVQLAEPITLPMTQTEYLTAEPDVAFGRSIFATDGVGYPYLATRARTYSPGDRLSETMFRGVMGPSFATAPEPIQSLTRPAWAYRRDDAIDVDIQTFSDTEAGHYGATFADVPAGWTRLYHDGELIGETDRGGYGTFTAPPGPVPTGWTSRRTPTEPDGWYRGPYDRSGRSGPPRPTRPPRFRSCRSGMFLISIG